MRRDRTPLEAAVIPVAAGIVIALLMTALLGHSGGTVVHSHSWYQLRAQRH